MLKDLTLKPDPVLEDLLERTRGTDWDPRDYGNGLLPADAASSGVIFHAFGDAFKRQELGRPCWPKIQNETREAAEAQLQGLVERGLHRDDSLHVYRCACGSWHIGHRGKKGGAS